MAELLGEMIENADRRDGSLSFLPGYDLETDCGIHVGPSILTTGAGGLLLRGPKISMRAGQYRMKISGCVLARHSGPVGVEVVSGRRKDVHFKGRIDSGADSNGVLIDCGFELPRSAVDVEIRCLVGSGSAIQLDSIRIDSNSN